MGLDEPRDLATTSLIPTTSQAALIGPPAIMPVPEGADLNNTFPAPSFDKTYEVAKANGAIGGKLSGAGGGGFFTFYCEEKQTQLRTAMKKEGSRPAKKQQKGSLFLLPSGRLHSFLRQLVDKDGCALGHKGKRAQIYRFFDRVAPGSHHS